MSGISDREKGLLVTAVVVILAVFYFVARVQPQRALVKSLTEETAKLEKEVGTIVLPKNTGDPETVNKQLAEVNARLGTAREELAAVFSKRVDETSNQALEGLMLEILTLAKAKGVSVDNSGAYAGSVADLGLAVKEELTRLQSGGEPFRFRPLRSLSLSGDYPHIQNFIKELPKLGHEVNVLRFSIKSVLSLSKGADGNESRDQKNTAQSRELRAELVLAL
jgi:hypothetical protein